MKVLFHLFFRLTIDPGRLPGWAVVYPVKKIEKLFLENLAALRTLLKVT